MQFQTYSKKVASPHLLKILKLIYILLQFSFMLTDLCFPTNLDLCSCEVYRCFVGTYLQFTWCYCVMRPILPFSLGAMLSRSICVAFCIHLVFASNCHLHSRVGSNTFTHAFFQGHSHCLHEQEEWCHVHVPMSPDGPVWGFPWGVQREAPLMATFYDMERTHHLLTALGLLRPPNYTSLQCIRWHPPVLICFCDYF